ncbi:MAG: DUF4145 domain-containing protein, partial [Pseudomonas sp.]
QRRPRKNLTSCPGLVDHYNPDYALAEFRKVAEFLVASLGARFHIEFEKKDLFYRIQELNESQIIDRSLSRALHEIRELGNEAVHSVSKSADPERVTDATNPAGDADKAIQARRTMVGILESVFIILHNGEVLPTVQLEEVGDIASQQILWRATTSSDDFESKFAAGLILEAQSMIVQNKKAVLISRKEDTHTKSLRTMAIGMYRAACEISANLDSLSITAIQLSFGGFDAALVKRADTESLYRFGSLTYFKDLKDETQQLGALAIEEAARRGHIEACVQYGEYLRMNGRHDEALAMMRFAVDHEDPLADLGLYLLYVDESSPHYSADKAVEALEGGVSRSCPKCKMELGRILYEGKYGEEDKERGKRLLQQADEAGNNAASMYLKLVVDDFFAKQMQAIGHALQISVQVEKAKIKSQAVGRNEKCPCGSGKKYKVCHLG